MTMRQQREFRVLLESRGAMDFPTSNELLTVTRAVIADPSYDTWPQPTEE